MSIKTKTCFDKDQNVQKKWKLGKGSFGKCYVLKIANNYRVLKILVDSSGYGDVEAEALENYKIPFIPKIYDKSSKHPLEPRYWILIDYIPGPTLEELISKGFNGGKISQLIILEILTCLIYQLSEMKKGDIKHRDLKPANIIVDAELIPHIIDWGETTTRNSISTSDKYHGTIPFMAPEAFHKERTTKSDIFSFGGVIFNLITGKCPFQDAFETYEGLEEITDMLDVDEKDRLKITDSNEQIITDYETLKDDKCNKNVKEYAMDVISEHVGRILSILIPDHGIVDQKCFSNDFLKDPFNAKLSELINKCWEFDTKKRISHEDIELFLSETAKQFLSPEDLKKYEEYCDKILEVDHGAEYGTEANVKATYTTGMYQASKALKEILRDNGFTVKDDDSTAIERFLQSVAPKQSH